MADEQTFPNKPVSNTALLGKGAFTLFYADINTCALPYYGLVSISELRFQFIVLTD